MTDKNVLTLKGTNERIDAIEKQIEEKEITLHKDLDYLRKEGEEEKRKNRRRFLLSMLSLLCLALSLGFFVFSSSEEEKGWVEFSTPLSPEWLVTEFNEEKGGITIKGEEDITLLPGDEILDALHRTRLKVEADGLAVIIKGNDILYRGYRYY